MKAVWIAFGLTTLLFTFALGNLKKKMAPKGSEGESFKREYDSSHSGIPKAPLQLATEIMTKLYRIRKVHYGGLSSMELMYKLDALRGVHRLQTLLMFEKMDTNSNGAIDVNEFVDVYGPATSATFRAFRTLFELYDYDKNNFISVWEILRNEASLLGFDFDLTELGKKAEQKFRSMDANGDSKVTEEEFVAYMSFLATTSIGKVKKETV